MINLVNEMHLSGGWKPPLKQFSYTTYPGDSEGATYNTLEWCLPTPRQSLENIP